MTPPSITHHSYGKSNVRLLKVIRGVDGAPDYVRDLCVNIALEGAFEATYLTGDNRNVIATDTMKNLVYVHGRQHPIDSVESFALTLASHFLKHDEQVSQATVSIESHRWTSIGIRALQRLSSEVNTAKALVNRSETIIESGIQGLDILKTDDSAFQNFHRDQWTTLKDAEHRLFRTHLNGCWRWNGRPEVFETSNGRIVRSMLEAFARHDSLSVQQTLYAMAQAALAACPTIDRVSLSLPNRHCNLVDLSAFGLENRNEVYVPTEEPFGLIEATIER